MTKVASEQWRKKARFMENVTTAFSILLADRCLKYVSIEICAAIFDSVTHNVGPQE